MANSDYIQKSGGFGFCPYAVLASSISALTTSAVMTGFQSPIENAIRIGMAAMIDGEIVEIVARSGNNLTLGRGCCDTIPAPHSAGAVIWFFDDSIAYDPAEYLGTETIGVKVLPRTTSGSPVPVAYAPGQTLTFGLRFTRPYPPGLVTVNGNPFTTAVEISEEDGMTVAWKHRDRVGQQDQLIDHMQDNVGPEPGTTYEIKVYKQDGTLVRTEATAGTSWFYSHVTAKSDFEAEYDNRPGYFTLASKRDGLLSFQLYNIPFTLLIPSQPYGLGYRLGESLGGVEP